MKKYILPSLVLAVLFFSSCSKNLEDRLIGSWKLNSSYRQKAFGRDHFTTGFESGVFTLNENGSAKYVSATDTLTGNWYSDRYTNSWYNGNDYESRSMKYLRIHLVNFQRNEFLDWEFDDFIFRNSWQQIKAEQYSLSNDRVYEFQRQ